MAHIMMLGGDRRSRELYHLLRAKHPEHTVDCMGLWEWEKSAAERNADIWILPFPSFRGELPRIPTMNGILGWSMEETAAMIPQGAKVICGLLPGHEHFAEICPAERIDLLKLDVEGDEMDALIGAAGTIRQSKPCLAVSVYHRTGDIFELPLRVLEMLPDFKLYLRREACIPAWDITLFALGN